ncbi:general secretion pathway protein J [Desulfocicer vacuolatum DSM 3385]|uniref:General secretion pathway protein J n=1 Tax=Desulfocicer vacuolatum DSM 3385 TaxID=1121400 RepID=A0A1W1ZFP0_9BACT|nr:prepilin-type N-terminal cleavage/methylation domain-containing protein [Desulfocicer vacuolatum]SMC47207.1 general secretion pathway protein J [Desulfocicer vacuolatum DSM 3385]
MEFVVDQGHISRFVVGRSGPEHGLPAAIMRKIYKPQMQLSTLNQKFISMRSVSVATFGWKGSEASPSNKGFTLMEILVAVVIFAILMTTVVSSFKAFVMSSDHIQTAIARDGALSIPLKIISRDLTFAHFSLSPAYVKPDTRSMPDPFRLVGDKDNVGGKDFFRLRFVSQGLLTIHGEGGHQRPVQIIYYVRANENGGFDLCRSESLPPWEDGVQNSCDPILIKDVSSFELAFLNGENERFTHWDSDGEAFDHATPRAIDVIIGYHAGKARDNSLAGDVIMTSIALPVYRDALE